MNEDRDRFHEMNDQALQWHAGTGHVDMDAFRLWALAGLSQRLLFDGAVWGLGLDTQGAHFHRTHPEALQGPGATGFLQRLGGVAPGRALAFEASAADGESRGPALDRALGIRFAEAPPGPGQFLMLRRDAASPAFDDATRAGLEWLAPHMMQAFSTCRKLHVAGDATDRGAHATVRASALVDRSGRIHEADARFARTLRREWTEWNGARLPEALINHKARKLASRWQFQGRQIVADFLPVNSLFLVTARYRLPADALTAREWDIARRYAEGGDYRTIADALALAPATVRSHLRRVFSKLGVHNKSQLAAAID